MTFSKIADSKVNVTIFKYNYNTYQLTVGNTMALLHEDEVRELIEYLNKKLDE